MRILEYQGPWTMVIEEAPLPQVGPNEVLLKSVAVGICGSDVHGFTGESGRRKAGMVMGHEAVGEVVKLGSKVIGLELGQRAAIFPTFGCGECEYCKKGWEHICPEKRIIGVNAGKWGAMADFYTANSRQVFPIADTIDPNLGLFTEPLAVAVHAVSIMKPAEGDIIAIVGAGTIGLALTLVLRDLKVSGIYVLDKIEDKLALAKAFGANPINVDNEKPDDAIERMTGNRRVLRVFEAVGTAATVRTAYDLCDFGGTIVLVGNLAKDFTLPLQGVTSNEITLRGSYGFNRADFAKAIELVTKNPDKLRRLISGFCSLEEAPGIMTEMAKGERHPIKMIIRP